MYRLKNVMMGIGVALVASPALAGPTVQVPEPASITLMAAGIAAVAWAKFRKRK